MLEKVPKAAIYCRVSTSDQHCQSQLDELRGYVERRGWSLCAEYIEMGWSGSKKDRPQLAKLMRDAKMHRFDIVLCWKLDRFARSLVNFVEALEDLNSWGVRFIVTSQLIDTDAQNPGSKLLMDIMAAFAEFERSLIQESVNAGISAAKRRGIHCGRKPIIVDRSKVRELHLQGKSIRQIAAKLKINRGKVHSIIKAATAA